LAIAILYGGVALAGQWKPKLGLDLQGGTMITLSANSSNGEQVTPDKLDQARQIIDDRVNGSGVTNAEVATQGGRQIVVEIPGKNAKNLVDTVKQTAQLRFRLVAAAAQGRPAKQPTPGATPSPSPSPSGSPKSKPSGSATPKGRALSSGLLKADKQPSQKPSKKPSGASSPSPSATPLAPQGATPAPTVQGAPVNDPLAWQSNPGAAWLKKFQAFTCPPKGQASKPVPDDKTKPLITCDKHGIKYLLSVPSIEGTELTNAAATPPDQQSVQWTVTLSLNGKGRQTMYQMSKALVNTQKQFAIVLDGKVLSAPGFTGVIPDGRAQITGNFTQASAQSLANSLKYGALPLKFTVPVVDQEGPTLAADQLSAGLWAGGIGLALVLLYCMLYYRGLGLVVVASLGLAAVVTYGVVLAMGQALNFTLTLPGIAGLIVAVGITADSFIVYFERIRDEMREGKSMRVAVEAGWARARNTCLAADGVSLLAAVVLYIFTIGDVKGFAFALGISTAIDLVVFFLFTKPMVSWLATFKFFSSGHRFSGLSPDHIGIDRIGRRPAAGPSAAGGNA
jgi:preprotein translocase subunit SecD